MIDYSLAKDIVDYFKKNGLKLSTAESCTGGLVSGTITAVAGASDVFDYGIVTYSNEMKTRMLTVSKEVLNTIGAVSEETAKMMAEGVRIKACADFGIATTGIAGPTGAVDGKPVGTVYIGVSSKDKTVAKRLDLGEECNFERQRIREETVNCVLRFLKDNL